MAKGQPLPFLDSILRAEGYKTGAFTLLLI